MIRFRQIVCPVDFSDISRRALDHAVALARRHKATITLVHVHHVIPVASAMQEMLPSLMLSADQREALTGALKRFAGRDASPPVSMEFEIAEGNPATAILETANAAFADLLVLGTHGRSGFERLLLGSVAEKLLHKADCPVLTVPPASGDTASVPPTFQRILCPIDFSDCSLRALEYASSLAQGADAYLTVAHVFDVEELLANWSETSSSSFQRELERLEDERRQRLADAVSATFGGANQVETVMGRGTPYREILHLADERESELIVMGTRGRRAPDLRFIGSTASHVVRRATCPVLTIRRG